MDERERGAAGADAGLIRLGDWIFDTEAQELSHPTLGTRKIKGLMRRLLLELAKRRGKVVRYDTLLSEVWQQEIDDTRRVHAAVSRLRKLLGDDHPIEIESADLGYTLRIRDTPSTSSGDTKLSVSPSRRPLATFGKWSERTSGRAPVVMYGAEEERQVADWAARLRDGTLRFLALIGMRGCGKSTKALSLWCRLFRDTADSPYQGALWISFGEGGAGTKVRSVVSQVKESLSVESQSADAAELFRLLGVRRLLVVLDNFETVISEQSNGEILPEQQEFEEVLHRLLRSPSITTVLTGCELPRIVKDALPTLQDGHHETLQAGVSEDAARQIVKAKLTKMRPTLPPGTVAEVDAAPDSDWDAVIKHVGRNPLMLESSVGHVLRDTKSPRNPKKCLERRSIPGEIQESLEGHWRRLRSEEREVLLWLAINRKPVTEEELQADLLTAQSQDSLRDTIRSLHSRLPLEELGTSTVRFGLHGIILDFSTRRAVREASNELDPDPPSYSLSDETERRLSQVIVRDAVQNFAEIERQGQDRESFRRLIESRLRHEGRSRFILIDHALLKLSSTISLQKLQRAEILQPILVKLGIGSCRSVAERLQHLLSLTRELPGYVAGNILNLLRELGKGSIDLPLDAAGAELRQADLRGLWVRAPIDLRNARFNRTALTQALGQPRVVRISPDGAYIAAGDNNNAVTTWKLDDLSAPARRHVRHTNTIRALAFSRDGRLLASTGEDRAVFIWGDWADARGEGPWSLFEDPRGVRQRHLENGPLRDLAFDRHGRLATASEDGTVWVHDLAKRRSQCWLSLRKPADGDGPPSDGRVHAIAMHPLRDLMIAGSSSGHLYSIELKRGKPRARKLHDAPEHTAPIWSVAFDSSGERFVSGGQDGFVHVWRTGDGAMLWNRGGQHRSSEGDAAKDVFAVAFTPDGDVIVSGGEDRAVYLWEAGTGDLRKRLIHDADEGHDDRVRSIATTTHSSLGSVFATGGFDRKLILWRPDGERISSVVGYGNGVMALAFGGTGELFGAYEDGYVRRWDLTKPRAPETPVHKHDKAALCVAFNPIDGRVFSGARDLAILNSGNGNDAVLFGRHDHWVASVDVSRDGTQLASGGEDGMVHVWQLGNGSRVSCTIRHGQLNLHGTARSHTDRVRVVRFSPDPAIGAVVSGGYDNAVRVWDSNTGTLRAELRNARQWVVALDVDRTGRLACAWGAGKIRLFDLRALVDRPNDTDHLAEWMASSKDTQRIFGVRFLPDGRLVTAGEDGLVRVWEIALGGLSAREEWRFEQHQKARDKPKVVALAVDDNGCIASGDSLGRTFVWRPGDTVVEDDCIRPRLPYEGLDLTGAKRLMTFPSGHDIPLDEGQRRALIQLGAKA